MTAIGRRVRPLAGLAVIALIAAGCSNVPAETGDGSGAASTAQYQQAVRFAECMRKNASRMPPTVALRTT